MSFLSIALRNLEDFCITEGLLEIYLSNSRDTRSIELLLDILLLQNSISFFFTIFKCFFRLLVGGFSGKMLLLGGGNTKDMLTLLILLIGYSPAVNGYLLFYLFAIKALFFISFNEFRDSNFKLIMLFTKDSLLCNKMRSTFSI